ncbi:MAG TPA: hypothetical protein VMH80_18830 [Bryobacteraceae bacterium]|nr:hypothetical protein [Bryobacteraceae bacterium]
MIKAAFGLFLFCGVLLPQSSSKGAWKFAVSGDSRNCGDIVMPAIAAGVRHDGASFYWHLGDFRAIYKLDEDMAPPPQLGLHAKPLSTPDYLSAAWPDFIAHQLVSFGNLPVFLGIGNHEAIPPMTREAWLVQFADWLETPLIRGQRLKDDPADHKLHAYYHWIRRNVDFITLDNATPDAFDAAQMAWLHALLERDETSSQIQTIVVGMHEALPDSVAHMHSMSASERGEQSGREVYEALWHAREAAHKQVYVLASHSHFYMENIFDTPDWKGKILPGWIIGTAGAVRYKLPPETTAAQNARTDVYGYLTGTVTNAGTVSFAFHTLSLEDLRKAVGEKYPEPLIRWCYDENKE